MKRAGLMLLGIAWGLAAGSAAAAAAGFQKVTAHAFFLPSKSNGRNCGIIVTPEGVLLIDPPPEAELNALMASMKAVTPRSLRWVVGTDYARASSDVFSTMAKQGVSILLGKELDRLSSRAPSADQAPPAPRATPRILFSRQMQLYPGTMEIRLLALKYKARTAGDVVIYFPSEKVLFAGGFFVPSAFPVIDAAPGEGTASGWIDALKQVIEFVPILKSAMPQPKQVQPLAPLAKPAEPEKSPEEMLAVITAEGAPTNLQNMKEVLSAAQKLRTQTVRAVSAGRSRDEFLKILQSETFSGLGNLESFAGQLFDELSRK